MPFTENQKNICQEYLAGERSQDDMYILFKTHLDEYIKIFGFKSWQTDPIKIILHNFCNHALHNTI